MREAKVRTRVEDRLVELQLVLGLNVDLVTEFARKRQTRQDRRHGTDKGAADIAKLEALSGHIVATNTRQQLARVRARQANAVVAP